MQNRFVFKAFGAAACALSLLLGGRASAQLNVAFQFPTQDVVAGSTITVDGTLTNTSNATLFLNGDNLVLDGSGLTVSDQPFLTDAPPSLAPAGTVGSNWTGGLFQVSADLSTVPDLYTGSFTVFGGADSLSGDTLAAPTFQVIVHPAAVPESSSSLGLGLLLLLGGIGVWRAQRRVPAAF